MATLGVERIMDRVSLVVDCNDDAEATDVYNLLVSQILDGRSIHLRIAEGDASNKSGEAKE